MGLPIFGRVCRREVDCRDMLPAQEVLHAVNIARTWNEAWEIEREA
jgi:hypothetical protein